MKVQVLVRLKPGVLDVQGKAVQRGLAASESEGASPASGVKDVRIGKLIELEVDAASEEKARAQVTSLCERVLTNTIIENFEIRFPG